MGIVRKSHKVKAFNFDSKGVEMGGPHDPGPKDPFRIIAVKPMQHGFLSKKALFFKIVTKNNHKNTGCVTAMGYRVLHFH
jgi:hypothetical protein